MNQHAFKFVDMRVMAAVGTALWASAGHTGLTLAGSAPVGTAFTYQGQLKQAGVPLNSSADMAFALWDVESDGTTPVAGPLVFDGQPENGSPIDVVNGLFTLDLDFGADVFKGNARWLEIEVRTPHDPTNTAPYTVLSPRQHLTPTPYALFALAGNQGPQGKRGPAGQDGQDGLNCWDLNGNGVRDAEEDVNGDGVVDVDDCRHPNRHSLDAADGDPVDVVYVDNDGSVGIGTTEPSAKLTIAGVGSDQTHGNSAIHLADWNKYFDYDAGMVVRGTGNGWATRFTSTDNMDPNGEIVGIYKAESTAGDIANGAGDIIATFRNDGNVGIGTSGPMAKLDIAGDIAVKGKTIVNAQGQWVGDPLGSSGVRGLLEFVGPGEHTWVAPEDVHRVTVELWGAHGGGGGGGGGVLIDDDPEDPDNPLVCDERGRGGWGGGGGGAGYLRVVLEVIPGETYIVSIGSGGSGGAGGPPGVSGSGGTGGTPTTFEQVVDVDETIVLALAGGGGGGQGGTGAGGPDGAGGVGGSVAPPQGLPRPGLDGGLGGFAFMPGATASGTVGLPYAALAPLRVGIGGAIDFGCGGGESGSAGHDGYAVLQW